LVHIGFLALIARRSVGGIPNAALAPLAAVADMLTAISMTALGLGTDLRAVANAGGRVVVVSLSLLLLERSAFASVCSTLADCALAARLIRRQSLPDCHSPTGLLKSLNQLAPPVAVMRRGLFVGDGRRLTRSRHR
jgi:hypothetical protein